MSTATQGYRSRSQQDAAAVYEKVTAIREQQNDAERKKYGGMCHKLPVLIRTAGLVQALAFLQAKQKEQMWQQLGKDLAGTLGYADLETLAGKAREASLGEYMVLTQRSLEQLLWYKRYAMAVLNVDGANAVEDGGAE